MTEVKQSILWVETDNEPDDLLGLRMLHRRGFSFHTIVVGETPDPVAKGDQLRHGNYAFIRDYTILIGAPSDKVHPRDPVTMRRHTNSQDYRSLDQYVTDLAAYLSAYERPVMVIMKPPRELLKAMQDPEANKVLFDLLKSKAVVYLYGSFNLRTLRVDNPTLHALLGLFHEVYLFESFHAVGESNSINGTTMPRLKRHWEQKMAQADLPLTFLNLWMYEWNNDLYRKQLPHASTSPLSAKIVDNISKHMDFQFVAADMVLCLYVEAPEGVLSQATTRTGIDWTDRGFSTKVELQGATTPVQLFEKLKFEDIERELMMYL
jgi:hypothetical protein